MRFASPSFIASLTVLALFLSIVGCGGGAPEPIQTGDIGGSDGGLGVQTDAALGLASVDLNIASASGAPPFDTMAGKGDALGYVGNGDRFDEMTGAGTFDSGAMVGSYKGPSQTLQISFDHSTFVDVGTMATLDGKSGTATYVVQKDGKSLSYHAVAGTATVAALGEGRSLTLALDGLLLRSDEVIVADLTLSGTATSSPLLAGGGYTNDNNLPDMGVLSGSLGTASLALPIRATVGDAPYSALTGTADDRGYVSITDVPPVKGTIGKFEATGFLVVPGTGSRQYQYLHLEFPHVGAIAVGTKATLDQSYNSAIYYAEGKHTGAFYDVTGGTVEVVALGPSSTYTVRLTDVTFTPERGGTSPTLVLSGTMSNAAENYGAPGTSGYAIGYPATTKAGIRSWSKPKSR